METDQRHVMDGVCERCTVPEIEVKSHHATGGISITYVLLDVKAERSHGLAWMTAAKFGHDKCLDSLIQAGADVNTSDHKNRTPLIEAASYAHYKCVDLLVQAGADVNHSDGQEMPLFSAISRPHEKCQRDFLKEGVAYQAESHNHEKCVALMIKSGAKVDAVDLNGNTPLKYAAKNGHHKSVELLTQNGASVNAVNENGNTALIMAAAYGRDKCVDTLLKAGADVNMSNQQGRAALVHAACNGFDRCMDLLIKAGADVNAITNRENTPLNKAAFSGNIESILLLLRAGANINTTNYIGKNALKIHLTECKRITNEIVMLLYAAGETLTNMDDSFAPSAEIMGISLKRLCRKAIRKQLILANKDYWGATVSQLSLPDSLKQTELKLCLKHQCRETIRKHLLQLDPRLHLFARIPQLGLPRLLNEYLLYDLSLEVEDERVEDLFEKENAEAINVALESDDDEYFSCEEEFN